MKLFLISLSLIGSLYASETVYPIIDTKVRTMVREGEVAANLMFSSTGMDGQDEKSIFLGVSRLNTWFHTSHKGLHGEVMITKREKGFQLHWKMKSAEENAEGSQPMVFAGEGPRFEKSFEFKKSDVGPEKLGDKAIFLQAVPVGLKIPLGKRSDALHWNGTARLYYQDGKVVAQFHPDRKNLRFNFAVQTEEGEVCSVDTQLDPLLQFKVNKLEKSVVRQGEDSDLVKFDFEFKVTAKFTARISRSERYKLNDESLQTWLPEVNTNAMNFDLEKIDYTQEVACMAGDKKSMGKSSVIVTVAK